MDSPFVVHREKVLGRSAAASRLRRLVLSMAGDGNGADLSFVRELDNDDGAIVVELLLAYRANPHGHAFHALAEACRRRARSDTCWIEARSARGQDARPSGPQVEAPLVAHRERILGHYWAASYLRRVVLSLGVEGATVDLSLLLSLDRTHAGAVVDILETFRADPEGRVFRELVDACLMRLADEQAAHERAERFESWLRLTRLHVDKLGLYQDLTVDRHGWFEDRFEAGDTPEQAARRARDEDIQAALDA